MATRLMASSWLAAAGLIVPFSPFKTMAGFVPCAVRRKRGFYPFFDDISDRTQRNVNHRLFDHGHVQLFHSVDFFSVTSLPWKSVMIPTVPIYAIRPNKQMFFDVH